MAIGAKKKNQLRTRFAVSGGGEGKGVLAKQLRRRGGCRWVVFEEGGRITKTVVAVIRPDAALLTPREGKKPTSSVRPIRKELTSRCQRKKKKGGFPMWRAG